MSESDATGPQVGDRVEVRITGTVVRRDGGKHPMLMVELDGDLVGVDGERVTTHEHPERAVLLDRSTGAPSTDAGTG